MTIGQGYQHGYNDGLAVGRAASEARVRELEDANLLLRQTFNDLLEFGHFSRPVCKMMHDALSDTSPLSTAIRSRIEREAMLAERERIAMWHEQRATALYDPVQKFGSHIAALHMQFAATIRSATDAE